MANLNSSLLPSLEPTIKNELLDEFDTDSSSVDKLSSSITEDISSKTEKYKLMKEYDKIETEFYILGRVFRNLEVRDINTEREIFGFIIKSLVMCGLLLNEDIKNGSIDWLGEVNSKRVTKAIKQFIPVMMQDFLYQVIGHKGMESIINERIKELESNSIDNNQFELFILKFCIIDGNLNSKINEIESFFDTLTNDLAKTSVLFKVMYYYMWKTTDSPERAQALLSIFQNQQKKLLGKDNQDKIPKMVEDIKKTRLFNSKNL